MNADWTSEPLRDYLLRLGSAAPTPGGGSAAALAGALAAALGRMVVSVAQEKSPHPDHARLLAAFSSQRDGFLRLAADDERAFDAVMAALRLAKDDAARPAALEAALVGAADVPLRAAASCLSLLETLREAEPHASRAIVSDIGAAAHLALACLSSSLLNVRVNERSIKDGALQSRLASQSEKLRAAGEEAHRALTARVAERLAPRP